MEKNLEDVGEAREECCMEKKRVIGRVGWWKREGKYLRMALRKLKEREENIERRMGEVLFVGYSIVAFSKI